MSEIRTHEAFCVVHKVDNKRGQVQFGPVPIYYFNYHISATIQRYTNTIDNQIMKGGNEDVLETLKKRYVNGEINKEEYDKMLNVIKKR